ncbi:hypothetical protein [Reichenbachiella ulvae]|uniref:Uncharacterized protein n=1 Tax=Reichenbachiella ulvae TaxID=2980104 RepID=A0ABT3CUA1_9BACT|nr:hypothetical protein [Reichenbachiella ulvae]MCV9387212.1 hypothetical protein [Reichenbachiella ulvae]
MRKVALVLAILTVTVMTASAQRETLWKSTNVELEEYTKESGEVVYHVYSKEMKYEEMFYLLTVSSGEIAEVYEDMQYFDKICELPKGTSETRKGMDIASRDGRSIFVVVEGEVGFTAIFHHDLKRVMKKLENRAEERGVSLTGTTGAVSQAADATQAK